MGGTTVKLLTCEANSMQKRSDQSLPYVFFTSKHIDLPGENCGFWRQTLILPLLGCYIATLFLQPNIWDVISKKTLAFTWWCYIHSVGTEMNFTSKNQISTSRSGDFTRNGGEWWCVFLFAMLIGKLTIAMGSWNIKLCVGYWRLMRLAMLEVFCVIEIYVRPQIDKPLITVCCLIISVANQPVEPLVCSRGFWF